MTENLAPLHDDLLLAIASLQIRARKTGTYRQEARSHIVEDPATPKPPIGSTASSHRTRILDPEQQPTEHEHHDTVYSLNCLGGLRLPVGKHSFLKDEHADKEDHRGCSSMQHHAINRSDNSDDAEHPPLHTVRA